MLTHFGAIPSRKKKIKGDTGSQSCDIADMYKLGITLLSESSCYGNRDRNGAAVKEGYPENGSY